MDILWMAAVAVMWVVVAEMVVGLNKLARPKRDPNSESGARS